MKLSEFAAMIQTQLAQHGDTDMCALSFVIDTEKYHRMDVFGAVTIVQDRAQYPNGITYFVADCNLQPYTLAKALLTAN